MPIYLDPKPNLVRPSFDDFSRAELAAIEAIQAIVPDARFLVPSIEGGDLVAALEGAGNLANAIGWALSRLVFGRRWLDARRPRDERDRTPSQDEWQRLIAENPGKKITELHRQAFQANALEDHEHGTYRRADEYTFTLSKTGRVAVESGAAKLLLTMADALEAERAKGASQEAAGTESAERLADARHSTDFRSVHWFGEDYEFTATQAACVKVLWEEWKNGTATVGQETILEMSGSTTSRLKSIFGNGKHPCWGAMIVPGEAKGTFRLQSPLVAEKLS